jgi:Zn-dependent protease
MDGSIRIGRVLGIPIFIHYTWVIVFGLVAWSLATGYFPIAGGGLSMSASLLLGAAAALLFFAALLLHELAHSWVGQREGLSIRSITLFIFGGVAQMGGEPRSAGAEFRMAIAGPATSLAVALLFWVAFAATRGVLSRPLQLLLQYLAVANLIVAVFNLIPAFPLDGGRVLRAALWHFTGSRLRATRIASTMGQGFAYLLMGLGVVRTLGGNPAGGLWTLFIGWFLLQAAQAGYRQTLIRRALRGIEARDVMRDGVAAVDGDLPLASFVQDHLLAGGETSFTVMDDGRLRGIITLEDVKRVPRPRWNEVLVKEAMTQEEACPTVDVARSAYEVLMLLTREGAPQVVVRHRGRFAGIITREDLLARIRTRLELEEA